MISTLLSAIIFPTADAGTLQWRRATKSCEAKLAVWNQATGRTAEELKFDLTEHNKAIRNIAPFNTVDLDNIVNGQQSLVVLGEGQSDLVETLIRQSLSRNSKLTADDVTIHAVDIIYAEPAVWSPGRKAFPSHYHAQYFQHFDIRSSGKRILFDEIWAPYSVGFLLGIEQVPRKAQAAILERAVDSLKAGGHIRIWNFYAGDPAHVWSILQEMKAAGKISHFQMVDFFLVIRK